MNKVYISFLKYHPENKLETEAFWFVFKSSCYKIFTNFPKKTLMVGGGNRKEPGTFLEKRVDYSHGFSSVFFRTT